MSLALVVGIGASGCVLLAQKLTWTLFFNYDRAYRYDSLNLIYASTLHGVWWVIG
jgi:hypothetical protein